MERIAFRHLVDVCYTEEEMKAIAAEVITLQHSILQFLFTQLQPH